MKLNLVGILPMFCLRVFLAGKGGASFSSRGFGESKSFGLFVGKIGRRGGGGGARRRGGG